MDHTAKRMRTDVLVVGGGAAGIRAAIASAEAGCDTLLVVDGKLAHSGSTFYDASPEWGFLYAEKDRVDAFYDDVLRAANGCVDEELVALLCKNSAERFQDLIRYGLTFHTLEELGIVPCFGQRSYGVMLKDMDTCRNALRNKLSSLKNLHIWENVKVATLVMKDGRFSGATGVTPSGEVFDISAAAAVLACGGAQNLYVHAYRNGFQNGAAYAMAAAKGARLVNLEFIQFINATLEPMAGINFYQFAFVTNPMITNSHGDRFLEKYLPCGFTERDLLRLRATHGPFSMADAAGNFDLAIVRESEACGAIGAWVRFDPQKLLTPRYEPWRRMLKRYGYTLETPMKIYPHCHAFNGGIRVGKQAQTDLPGVFACGESAGGYHGTNRMGGNSMLGTQVFGEIAGRNAAEFAIEAGPTEVRKRDYLDSLESDCAGFNGQMSPEMAIPEVQKIMQQYAFLERNEIGLKIALQRLNALCDMKNPISFYGTEKFADAAAAMHAVQSARLIITAMLNRRETRGGHNRTDYPATLQQYDGMQEIYLRDNRAVSEFG